MGGGLCHLQYRCYLGEKKKTYTFICDQDALLESILIYLAARNRCPLVFETIEKLVHLFLGQS